MKRNAAKAMKPKRRILFLFQLPPPVHGASMVNQTIAESQLISQTFDATFYDISTAKKISDIGRFSLAKILTVGSLLKRVYKIYRLKNPDLVYITLSPVGFAFFKDSLIVLLLKLQGARLVFHMHGQGISRISKYLKHFYQLVFKQVDVIHLSEQLFSDLDGVRDVEKSITAVNNGVPDLSVENIPGEKNQKLNIIYLSNLVPDKGAGVLVEAVNRIDSHFDGQYEVFLAGDFQTRLFEEQLMRMPHANVKDLIHFLGPLYGAEKQQLLASGDVFVLPSRNECFPLSILEAMATGMAVISTNVGAIAEIVDDGVSGIVMDDPDPEVLARKLEYFLEMPEEVQRMKKASRSRYLQNYTVEKFETSLCRVLSRLVEESHSPP